MADALSQSDIDKLIEAQKAKELGIQPQDAIRVYSRKYICAYCKSLITLEFATPKYARQYYAAKPRGKRRCRHWYVSEEYLKSLRR
jgi:hypothetical protein